MGEGPWAAAFALRELGLCDIKFAKRREQCSANGALGAGARAPGWDKPTPGFLCVSARATLLVRSQITAPARASPAFPGLPRPCPGSTGACRRFPASPWLPLALAGLFPSSLSLGLSFSEHTD